MSAENQFRWRFPPPGEKNIFQIPLYEKPSVSFTPSLITSSWLGEWLSMLPSQPSMLTAALWPIKWSYWTNQRIFISCGWIGFHAINLTWLLLWLEWEPILNDKTRRKGLLSGLNSLWWTLVFSYINGAHEVYRNWDIFKLGLFFRYYWKNVKEN